MADGWRGAVPRRGAGDLLDREQFARGKGGREASGAIQESLMQDTHGIRGVASLAGDPFQAAMCAHGLPMVTPPVASL